MPTVVIVLLGALACAVVIGVIVLYIGLRKARNGFEDQKGFHSEPPPKH